MANVWNCTVVYSISVCTAAVMSMLHRCACAHMIRMADDLLFLHFAVVLCKTVQAVVSTLWSRPCAVVLCIPTHQLSLEEVLVDKE